MTTEYVREQIDAARQSLLILARNTANDDLADGLTMLVQRCLVPTTEQAPVALYVGISHVIRQLTEGLIAGWNVAELPAGIDALAALRRAANTIEGDYLKVPEPRPYTLDEFADHVRACRRNARDLGAMLQTMASHCPANAEDEINEARSYADSCLNVLNEITTV